MITTSLLFIAICYCNSRRDIKKSQSIPKYIQEEKNLTTLKEVQAKNNTGSKEKTPPPKPP